MAPFVRYNDKENNEAEEFTMINPYEDLFRKDPNAASPNPTPISTAPVPDIDPLDEIEPNRRTNFFLLIVYILGLVAVKIFMSIYPSYAYPDPEATLAAITEIEVSYETFDNTDDPAYPYGVTLHGVFLNQNAHTVGQIWVEFTAYDDQGTRIGSTYYSQDDIASLSEYTIDDTVVYTVPIAEIGYEYGFSLSSRFTLMVNFFHSLLIAIAFVWIDRFHLVDRWRRFKKDWKSAVAHIVVGFILVWAAMIVSTIILQSLGVYGTSENEAVIASMFSPDNFTLFLLFLTLCIFTPIVEEIFYRKVLFGFFAKRVGPIPPIIVSGLIFGLMHVASFGDFIQAIPYVAMGMVFGYI
ncbi:MAG: CPBP family glutamic-type intramembrane protease, partial [bacterium]